MAIEYPGREQTGGHSRTKAQWISTFGTKAGLPNQLIITSDHWWTVTDGSTQLQNLEWFKFDPSTGNIQTTDSFSKGRAGTQPIDIYHPSGPTYSLIESGDGTSTGYRFKNSLGEFILYVDSAGNGKILDNTNSKIPLLISPNCLNNLIAMYSPGRVDIGGGFGIGSGGRLTIVTGSYSGLDVSDTAFISANTVGGNITLNDMVNGSDGQIILINRSSSANVFNITYASGSNQQIFNNNEVTLNLANVWSNFMSYDPVNDRWVVAGGLL